MSPRRALPPLLALALVLSWALPSPATASTELPFRRAGSNLIVSFSGGTVQLVLEGKTGNGWKPLAIQYGGRGIQTWSSRTNPKTGQGIVTFTIPRGYLPNQLRIISSPAKFPTARLRGPKDFPGTVPASTQVMSSSMTGNVAVNATRSTDSSIPSTVTESDIWKVIGNQLFFFNQYRGLQIFDLRDPAQPTRTGSLRLAASGEQFYALDESGSNLALLATDYSTQTSSVYLISVKDGRPSLEGTLPVAGHVEDSRLIGSRLYVASSDSSWTNSSFRSTVTIQGFDLTNLKSPIRFTPVSGEGYAPVLQGTNSTLLVASTAPSDWNRSRVFVIDISSPTGQPTLVKTLIAKGSVADQFKLHVANGTISVVSNSWDWTTGWSARKTWVENFPVAGEDVTPLAQLELEAARGESLHATRFDGDKLYVVTFLNIDPLFVVDLSDPAAPKVTGHLEIPGWSTYIQPYGDRLLAIGVEDGKVTVSLFDVADPAAPSLLSRVALGEGSSWSEANYDEKAAGFFPEQGLALVPYQTWGPNGWKNATAVVQVSDQGLTYQSSIDHEFTARRAAVSGNHILSISGQELIVENAQDLKALVRLSQLSLSWQVDRVVPFGSSHLIQIEDGEETNGYLGWYSLRYWSRNNLRPTMLRISPASSPDDLIEEIDMGQGRVIGAVERDGRLYVGQYVSGTTGQNLLRTWVFDASAPPTLRELTHVDTPLETGAARLNLNQATALWPTPTTLVWHIPAFAFYSQYMPLRPVFLADNPVISSGASSIVLGASSTPLSSTVLTNSPQPLQTLTLTNSAPAPVNKSSKTTTSSAAGNVVLSNTTAALSLVMGSPVIYPWYGSASDVAAVLCPILTAPQQGTARALAALAIQGTQGAAVRSFHGGAFGSGGFVLSSYQEDGTDSARSSRRRAWLQVVDFRDASAVVARDRVSIPGELIAASEIDSRGALLITVDSNGNTFRACAYDGLSAYQLDTWTTNDQGLATTASPSGRVFLARTWNNPQIRSLGYDSVSGRLQVSSALSLSEPIYELTAREDVLFASGPASVSAVKFNASGALSSPVVLRTSSNLWINLDRTSYLPGNGAWFPAGAYGVEFLSLKTP